MGRERRSGKPVDKRYRRTQGRVLAALAVVCLAGLGVTAGALAGERERINVVGAATVFPLALASAEAFHVKTGHKTPLVEANGSSAGFRLFCAGLGAEHPDIVTAERPIAADEAAACRQKGISPIEVKIGHQAVVLAKSRRGAALSLTPQQILLALAAEGAGGGNPYKLWSDIDFALPVKPIEVLGPPRTSPHRGVFMDLIMTPKAKRSAKAPEAATALRDDGVFVQVATEDRQVLDRLDRNPDALGIFAFNFQQDNTERLQAVAVDGVAPSAASIADGRYGPSRALYLYVKRQHLDSIPGLRSYVAEIAGEAASGTGGYLTRRGLIPLLPAERAARAEATAGLLPAPN